MNKDWRVERPGASGEKDGGIPETIGKVAEGLDKAISRLMAGVGLRFGSNGSGDD